MKIGSYDLSVLAVKGFQGAIGGAMAALIGLLTTNPESLSGTRGWAIVGAGALAGVAAAFHIDLNQYLSWVKVQTKTGTDDSKEQS